MAVKKWNRKPAICVCKKAIFNDQRGATASTVTKPGFPWSPYHLQLLNQPPGSGFGLDWGQASSLTGIIPWPAHKKTLFIAFLTSTLLSSYALKGSPCSSMTKAASMSVPPLISPPDCWDRAVILWQYYDGTGLDWQWTASIQEIMRHSFDLFLNLQE